MKGAAKAAIAAIAALGGVALVRAHRAWADVYATEIYPRTSAALSWLTGWIPFSMEEVVVGAAAVAAVACLARLRRRWLPLLSLILWLGVWFYPGWGLNYFRSSIFERAGVSPAEFEESRFREFLEGFSAGLGRAYELGAEDLHNASFGLSSSVSSSSSAASSIPAASSSPASSSIPAASSSSAASSFPAVSSSSVASSLLAASSDYVASASLQQGEAAPGLDLTLLEREVRGFYEALPARWGLARPKAWQRPKRLLLDRLYSSVGVMGFVGPFFNEIQVGGDVPVVQYPFTYAHEYSHLLGVSSEAEANYWAWEACCASAAPAIRYSAYLSLLPYVARHARRLLSEEEYAAWAGSLHPGALEDYDATQAHWDALYSPFIGRIQNWAYNLYLKGNSIPAGTADYSGVIRIILSLDRHPLSFDLG